VGLAVQKPIQALKSIKGPGNTFDLNPKWARTLPLGIFHGIFIEPYPLSTIVAIYYFRFDGFYQ
jgi:hypothetical protein